MGSGTDGFAALLGALKERSGLSYGVLAQRLHVGTSTLHRYVRGESVPPEYATIEKFARLTGATAAEMAELYRLWMAAAEERSSSGAEVVSSLAPSVLVSPPLSADAAAPPATEVRQDPPPTQVRQDPPPTEVRQDPPPTEVRQDLPPLAKPRRSLLLPAIAAVGVLGLGAAVAGVAFASSGSSPQPSLVAASDSSSSTASSSPSSSYPSTPALSSTPALLSTSSPTPTPALPAPLSVDIRPYQWEDKCNQWYLLNRKPGEVPPPPSEQDARGWARALGAVPAGTMKIEVAVQGTSSDTVVLHGLHIRTVSKAAPLPWSAYSMASGCGGGLVPASFAVELDAARPLAHPKAGQQGDTVIPAVDFPFKVSKADPQVLTIYAHAASANVNWYLELDWSSGGRSGTVRIDDHGRPFQTSGAKGRPLYDYDIGSNTWLPDDTAEVN